MGPPSSIRRNAKGIRGSQGLLLGYIIALQGQAQGSWHLVILCCVRPQRPGSASPPADQGGYSRDVCVVVAVGGELRD